MIATRIPRKTAPALPALPTVANIDVRLVDPSPFQPRTAFDSAELAALAETLQQAGQKVPILVRPKGDRYELVDGERRWRATKLAGLPTIRAEVQDLDDDQARAAVVLTALQRADLNPLEEARAYQQLIASGQAAGPTEAAAICGVSQGQVSNLLGLLKLPADPWHGLIAAGALPPTHARALAPWAQYPAVLDYVAKAMRSPGYQDDEDDEDDQVGEPDKKAAISAETFRRIVQMAVRENSEPMTGKEWNVAIHENVPIFAPTDEQRAALEIVHVRNWGPQPEPRAMNVALWKKLQAKHVRAYVKDRQQRNDGRQIGAAKKHPRSAAKPKDKPLSDEERLRKKREWLATVLQWLIAQQVPRLSDVAVLRLLLIGGVLYGDAPLDQHDICRALARRRGNKAAVTGYREGCRVGLKGLRAADASDLADCARDVAAAAFWDPGADCPRNNVDDEALPAVAAAVGVDLKEAWEDGALAPHYRAYLDLCTDAELHPLATALDVPTQQQMARGSMIQAIVAAMPKPESKELGPPLPKDLAAMWKKGQKL